MIDLALEPLCKFQISTHTTAKLDLDEALIIQDLDTRMTSLNKYVSLITSLNNSDVIVKRYLRCLLMLTIRKLA